MKQMEKIQDDFLYAGKDFYDNSNIESLGITKAPDNQEGKADALRFLNDMIDLVTASEEPIEFAGCINQDMIERHPTKKIQMGLYLMVHTK